MQDLGVFFLCGFFLGGGGEGRGRGWEGGGGRDVVSIFYVFLY